MRARLRTLILAALCAFSAPAFAQDAAVLVAGGYTLDWVQVVDQFRWSAHVELAGCFSRNA